MLLASIDDIGSSRVTVSHKYLLCCVKVKVRKEEREETNGTKYLPERSLSLNLAPEKLFRYFYVDSQICRQVTKISEQLQLF